jgi:hypothetical protein
MFSIQHGYSGREMYAVVNSANSLGMDYTWKVVANEGTVPIGTVEYCEPLFGEHRRDFYPDFLKQWLCRSIWQHNNDRPIELATQYQLFVKCAITWKSPIESRLWKTGEILPPGVWWMSEPVRFVQEWRYYVADGDLIATGWYLGNNEDEPAPQLDIKWPKEFSGAVDFGRLDDGRIALVECHAPFACGWYGDDHVDYVFWQAVAWEHRAWWKPVNASITYTNVSAG